MRSRISADVFSNASMAAIAILMLSRIPHLNLAVIASWRPIYHVVRFIGGPRSRETANLVLDAKNVTLIPSDLSVRDARPAIR
jgi:hypothetical protein